MSGSLHHPRLDTNDISQIGGGVLGDCFRPEERGKALAIYGLAPLLDPAIGPIAGGFIAEKTTCDGCFMQRPSQQGSFKLRVFFFLSDTYAPVILCNKTKKLRKETGKLNYQTQSERKHQSPGEILSTALIRPFRLLTTQPIVQILALYMAIDKLQEVCN